MTGPAAPLDSVAAPGEPCGAAAFALAVPAALPLPVLIAVPHAGRGYPESLTAAMREPAWGAARLEDRFVDLLGEAAARATGAALLVARAPRAMIDLNRAPDDVDWSMVAGAGGRRAPHSAANRRARSGLGLVPRRLPGLGEVWKERLALADLDARLETIHRPYHRAISETLDRLRDRWGAALLIDLHSMPPLRQPGHAGEGAEFVVGDRFGASCAPGLSAHALRHLARAGRRVAHNRPYSGGYALDHHAAPRRGVHAMQVEVCRSIYLDARLDQPGPRLPAVAKALAGLVRSLAEEVAALGNPDAHRQAAQ
ncbi:MAG: N-formylglutamate amidohydrolase [Qipengyuania sp.]|nr:N-formylglutamate amidohydrolase [Qipengyuania sp.]